MSINRHRPITHALSRHPIRKGSRGPEGKKTETEMERIDKARKAQNFLEAMAKGRVNPILHAQRANEKLRKSKISAGERGGDQEISIRAQQLVHKIAYKEASRVVAEESAKRKITRTVEALGAGVIFATVATGGITIPVALGVLGVGATAELVRRRWEKKAQEKALKERVERQMKKDLKTQARKGSEYLKSASSAMLSLSSPHREAILRELQEKDLLPKGELPTPDQKDAFNKVSEQINTAFEIFDLARDPKARKKISHNVETHATAVVKTIEEYISRLPTTQLDQLRQQNPQAYNAVAKYKKWKKDYIQYVRVLHEIQNADYETMIHPQLAGALTHAEEKRKANTGSQWRSSAIHAGVTGLGIGLGLTASVLAPEITVAVALGATLTPVGTVLARPLVDLEKQVHAKEQRRALQNKEIEEKKKKEIKRQAKKRIQRARKLDKEYARNLRELYKLELPPATQEPSVVTKTIAKEPPTGKENFKPLTEEQLEKVASKVLEQWKKGFKIPDVNTTFRIQEKNDEHFPQLLKDYLKLELQRRQLRQEDEERITALHEQQSDKMLSLLSQFAFYGRTRELPEETKNTFRDILKQRKNGTSTSTDLLKKLYQKNTIARSLASAIHQQIDTAFAEVIAETPTGTEPPTGTKSGATALFQEGEFREGANTTSNFLTIFESKQKQYAQELKELTQEAIEQITSFLPKGPKSQILNNPQLTQAIKDYFTAELLAIEKDNNSPERLQASITKSQTKALNRLASSLGILNPGSSITEENFIQAMNFIQTNLGKPLKQTSPNELMQLADSLTDPSQKAMVQIVALDQILDKTIESTIKSQIAVAEREMPKSEPDTNPSGKLMVAVLDAATKVRNNIPNALETYLQQKNIDPNDLQAVQTALIQATGSLTPQEVKQIWNKARELAGEVRQNLPNIKAKGFEPAQAYNQALLEATARILLQKGSEAQTQKALPLRQETQRPNDNEPNRPHFDESGETIHDYLPTDQESPKEELKEKLLNEITSTTKGAKLAKLLPAIYQLTPEQAQTLLRIAQQFEQRGVTNPYATALGLVRTNTNSTSTQQTDFPQPSDKSKPGETIHENPEEIKQKILSALEEEAKNNQTIGPIASKVAKKLYADELHAILDLAEKFKQQGDQTPYYSALVSFISKNKRPKNTSTAKTTHTLNKEDLIPPASAEDLGINPSNIGTSKGQSPEQPIHTGTKPPTGTETPTQETPAQTLAGTAAAQEPTEPPAVAPTETPEKPPKTPAEPTEMTETEKPSVQNKSFFSKIKKWGSRLFRRAPEGSQTPTGKSKANSPAKPTTPPTGQQATAQAQKEGPQPKTPVDTEEPTDSNSPTALLETENPHLARSGTSQAPEKDIPDWQKQRDITIQKLQELASKLEGAKDLKLRLQQTIQTREDWEKFLGHYNFRMQKDAQLSSYPQPADFSDGTLAPKTYAKAIELALDYVNTLHQQQRFEEENTTHLPPDTTIRITH